MPTTQIQTAAVTTLIIYLKLLATQITQGTKKGIAGGKGPEDGGTGFSAVGGNGDVLEEDKAKIEASARWDRILGNDLENIPVGLIIMWTCALLNPDSTAFMTLAIMFCAGRCLHTLMYMFEKQPFRSLSFAVATIGTLGMAILSISTVFQ